MQNNELVRNSEIGVKASEVFASQSEIERANLAAIREGIINFEVVPDGVEADIYPVVLVDESQVETDKLDDYHKKFGMYVDFDAAHIKEDEKPKVLEKINETIEERFIEHAYFDTWFLNDPELSKELEDGEISEALEFMLNDKIVPLFNFSKTKLTNEDINNIQKALEATANLSGTKLFDTLNAICIQSEDKFEGTVLGSARSSSSVIRLNEVLLEEKATGYFKGELLERFTKHGITPLTNTLTHEIGHILEFEDTENGAFAEATGWETQINSLMDDYGYFRYAEHNRISNQIPNRIKLTKDGKQIKINPRQLYGKEAIDKAKPVSRYAYTNAQEDFAEAFVPYIHTESKDYDALDPVRRNIISGILHRGSGGEYGPFQVSFKQADLSKKIGLDFKPGTYKVREPKVSLHAIEPVNNTFTQEQYLDRQRKIVDDYGNEIDSSVRQVTNY